MSTLSQFADPYADTLELPTNWGTSAFAAEWEREQIDIHLGAHFQVVREIGRGGIVIQHQNAAVITQNEVRFVGILAAQTASGSDRIGIRDDRTDLSRIDGQCDASIDLAGEQHRRELLAGLDPLDVSACCTATWASASATQISAFRNSSAASIESTPVNFKTTRSF